MERKHDIQTFTFKSTRKTEKTSFSFLTVLSAPTEQCCCGSTKNDGVLNRFPFSRGPKLDPQQIESSVSLEVRFKIHREASPMMTTGFATILLSRRELLRNGLVAFLNFFGHVLNARRAPRVLLPCTLSARENFLRTWRQIFFGADPACLQILWRWRFASLFSEWIKQTL